MPLFIIFQFLVKAPNNNCVPCKKVKTCCFRKKKNL